MKSDRYFTLDNKKTKFEVFVSLIQFDFASVNCSKCQQAMCGNRKENDCMPLGTSFEVNAREREKNMSVSNDIHNDV